MTTRMEMIEAVVSKLELEGLRKESMQVVLKGLRDAELYLLGMELGIEVRP